MPYRLRLTGSDLPREAGHFAYFFRVDEGVGRNGHTLQTLHTGLELLRKERQTLQVSTDCTMVLSWQGREGISSRFRFLVRSWQKKDSLNSLAIFLFNF